ncbi:hypothetical protein CXB51_018936 [Gossypium anomalum]|uniref:Retrotransposon gag domain-containing protein n=1 Tax=Gossypium anomalum TaxID=47600 RepID=A0A8J5YN42_9ROSI|nr:hypothetical protein CXB51_018936 [Gossypium anomalum]
MDLETLYNAWERYKDLLWRCPHHGLPLWLQVQTFYNGVNPSTRQMIDAAAGGTMNNKTPEAAYKFIEELSLNNYQWQVIRTKPTKTAAFITSMRLEEPPKFLIGCPRESKNTETALKNQQASIQGLETQIGHLSKLISERPQGSFPSNTEPNPREQLNAINISSEEGLVASEPESKQESMESKGKGKMPNAMKFLKELLTNNRKLDEAPHVESNAVCSAILQNKLPNKLKDPGIFTIPCLIGSLDVNNALADLGASINVVPYKMFKQLGLGKPKQTRMSIQLADKTIRFSRGIVEDVLVRIEKFIFPVDFVILDIEEDSNGPLILGRPFLATARTIIDVGTGELTLRVGDKTITPQACNLSNISKIEGGCIKHSTKTENMLQPTLQEISSKDIHEPCSSNNKGPIHEERRLQIEELDELRTD